MTDSVRGKYLIAGHHLKDPNFFRTVVLMVEDNDGGSMGLVVNRPTEVEVRQAIAEHFDLPELDEPVYYGGPVEPEALFVLHNSVENSGGELPILPGLFVGNSAEAFEQIVKSVAANGDEMRYRVFAGCAGWSPGQLDGEIRRGDWHLVEGETDLLFSADPYDAWDRMIRHAGDPHPFFPDQKGNPEWN
ncbi:YqgE/AlgH family protein [Stratiformator vulcanicus]|uniref:UPF0301 protein Pan189_41130 n=1 Tax=Stratiformator vulcanicus TaxID=2527980 RepID=A0A517R740_9PLAN|nr:YqgE/AlgH family protein [Stratiformator vulcanicus]QDT39704.1 hypothetical protein Pan189_41130 [Stratiformator vulcanicus]